MIQTYMTEQLLFINDFMDAVKVLLLFGKTIGFNATTFKIRP